VSDAEMFYPGITEQFLEAVLNISEKVAGFAWKSKAVGDPNARRSNDRRPATEPVNQAAQRGHIYRHHIRYLRRLLLRNSLDAFSRP
jgi:hypothetical protein